MANNKKTLSQQEVEQLFLKQGLEVLEPYVNSRTRIKAKCLGCGRTVEPYYRQIWSGQSGCRDCSSQKFKLSPHEISETLDVVNLKLMGAYKNSKTPLQVECLKCGHESFVILGDIRNSEKFNCSGCDPKKSFLGRRRKLTKFELDAAKSEFLDFQFELIGKYQSTRKPVLVKHLTCGTQSERSLKNIKSGIGFCAGCMTNRTLTESEALAVLQNAGFEPIGKYVNSETPWEAKCKKCKRVLSPTIHTLKGKDSGCAFCNKVKVDPIDAEQLMISAGYTPLEPYKSSKSKWKCRHEVCGQIVFPRYNTIQNGQGGCTDCADKYSYYETSYFYVMEHEAFQSLKIGISNTDSKDDRVLVHSKHGWKLVQRIEFENGFLAYEFEQTLLNHLRKNLNIPIHLSKSEMPQSGFSETLSVNFISLADLLILVKANRSGELLA